MFQHADEQLRPLLIISTSTYFNDVEIIYFNIYFNTQVNTPNVEVECLAFRMHMQKASPNNDENFNVQKVSQFNIYQWTGVPNYWTV